MLDLQRWLQPLVTLLTVRKCSNVLNWCPLNKWIKLQLGVRIKYLGGSSPIWAKWEIVWVSIMSERKVLSFHSLYIKQSIYQDSWEGGGLWIFKTFFPFSPITLNTNTEFPSLSPQTLPCAEMKRTITLHVYWCICFSPQAISASVAIWILSNF